MENFNYLSFFGHSLQGIHGRQIGKALEKLYKGNPLNIEICGLLLERDLVLIYTEGQSRGIDIVFYSDNIDYAKKVNKAIMIITPDMEEYKSRKIDILYCNLETDSSFNGSLYSYLSENSRKSCLQNEHTIIIALKFGTGDILSEIENLSGFDYTEDIYATKNTEIRIAKYIDQETKKKESKKNQDSEK